MKKNGAVSDFAAERNSELYHTFRQIVINARPGSSYLENCARAGQSPSSRFWISESRAAEVISGFEKIAAKRRRCGLPDLDLDNPKRGAILEKILFSDSALPQRKKMFLEIYRRYRILRLANPDRPISHLIGEVIEQPAPSFYLTASGVRSIVERELKRRRYCSKK